MQTNAFLPHDDWSNPELRYGFENVVYRVSKDDFDALTSRYHSDRFANGHEAGARND
jgi:hypothetical protein